MRTLSLGRWAVPLSLLRTLALRLSDAVFILTLGRRLTGFTPNSFCSVFDPLALIGFWLFQGADISRHLANQLFVVAGDCHNILLNLSLDSGRQIEFDRMREA